MNGSVLDAALEALVLFVEVVLTGLMLTIGLFAEQASLANFAAGEIPVGFWLACVGTLALFAGVYLLGYRRLVPRVA
jgi:hypothetical protein